MNVATEGFDCPDIDVVVMGRPTKSRALYAQMVGRGTRPLGGLVDGLEDADERRAKIATSAKPFLTVLDFVGVTGRHRLVTEADILGGRYSQEVVDLAREIIERESSSDKPHDVKAVLERSAEEIERRKEARERAKREADLKAARMAKYMPRAIYKLSKPEDALRLVGATPWRVKPWDAKREPSAKMAALLRRNGLEPDKFTYTQARQMVGIILKRWKLGLCTLKQARLLAKYGYDPKSMTKDQATRTIDAIKANRWRRPR